METITTYDKLEDFQEEAKKRKADQIFYRPVILPLEAKPGAYNILIQLSALTYNEQETRLLTYTDKVFLGAVINSEETEKAANEGLLKRIGEILNALKMYNPTSLAVQGAIEFRR